MRMASGSRVSAIFRDIDDGRELKRKGFVCLLFGGRGLSREYTNMRARECG